jgi:hypothetical protein
MARSSLVLVVVLTMIWSAGCGRKGLPEPRKSESSSMAILIGAR